MKALFTQKRTRLVFSMHQLGFGSLVVLDFFVGVFSVLSPK